MTEWAVRRIVENGLPIIFCGTCGEAVWHYDHWSNASLWPGWETDMEAAMVEHRLDCARVLMEAAP